MQIDYAMIVVGVFLLQGCWLCLWRLQYTVPPRIYLHDLLYICM